MFKTAQLYAEAAGRLSGAAPSMLIPSAVIAALALELSFKSLYLLEFSREFKVKGRHSHDFFALFEELPPSTREELIRSFDARLATRDMQDIRTIEQHGVAVALDLPSNLKQWSTVFTDLRYVHEFTAGSVGKQAYWLFFPEIHAVVSDANIARGTRL